jgi:diacylglycerol kinase
MLGLQSPEVTLPSKPPSFLARRIASFRFAWAGLKHIIAAERNAKLHIAASLVAIMLGLLLGLSAAEWLWIVLAIGWVWTAETFNTSIERLADAVTMERDERIRAIKDMAAAGVLVSAAGALVIGAIIFLPHLWVLIEHGR